MPVTNFDKLLDEKEAKIKELKDAINSETSLKLELLHKSNKVKLNPDKVKEEYELSKAPTEKQIQAYIDEKYPDLTNDYELAKQNTSLIRKDLELIDNRISFEKYVLQLEMKQ
ncbi:hypothetical protein [Methanobrevibacter sp.]|uniref:hypothetical protein n=1 Tax=Methanobrevibacter sp. TaxID=66852 RepID=UPI0025E8B42C|nr:hypothetical protein [Methanobrevibacter sp.]MBQ2832406.1 hypothetical protein [Methanobrevibacter sp.]